MDMELLVLFECVREFKVGSLWFVGNVFGGLIVSGGV